VILTLEYMECNLRELLRNSGPLSLVLVKSFTHQILQGVAYAKSKRCVHRDLKPANVLVMSRQGVVKLADYGLGRAFDLSGGRYTRQASLPFDTGACANFLHLCQPYKFAVTFGW
jgi:negative regulator of the PHO system